MAHSCPDCSLACYCNGDIDDIDVGDEEAADNCTHCLGKPLDDDYNPEDDYDDTDFYEGR